MSDAPKVTVGVCGGVAAYRAVELVRALQDAGFDPHVVMTDAAQEFVRPLTFAAISNHKVITTLWSGPEVPGGVSSVEHIEQAQTTRALILVPATASILGKLAHGIADDFLTTLYLATEAPVLIAPAMNVVMWNHPAVQANVATLRSRGAIFIDPDSGHLACGMQGSGRLATLPAIVEALRQALAPTDQSFANQTILITAGGTREPIDQVRFLGNRSSGRMGYALAEAAQKRGANVILISTTNALPCPAGVELIPVNTAAEMHHAVLDHLPRASALLMAAAVADFRPARVDPGKVHREGSLTLTLEPTEDTVAEAARQRSPGTLILAFAAEIGLNLERAREKMLRKQVDAILVNDIATPGLGFDSAHNAGALITRDRTLDISATTKHAMAAIILDELASIRAFTTASPSE